MACLATATCNVDKLNLSGGVRYDHRHLHSDNLMEDEEDGGVVERFKAFSRGFDGFSGSLGMLTNCCRTLISS